MPYADKKKLYEAQRNHRIKVRQELLKYLQEHPCVTCGETDPVVLDFDHLRDKKQDIARMLAGHWSWKSILKEIDKCQILCSNCHRRKTHKQFGFWGRSSVE